MVEDKKENTKLKEKNNLEKKATKDFTKKEDDKDLKKDVKEETKTEETKLVKEDKKEKVSKKDDAFARGVGLRISMKYSVAVCKMLRGKSPEKAIEILEQISKGRMAVPMHNLEVPHQKGKGIAGGKYPKNVAVEMIKVIKQAKANSIVNGIENPFISEIKANQAPRPYRKDRTRGKRTHIYIEIKSRAQK